jgi:hypothetical protein
MEQGTRPHTCEESRWPIITELYSSIGGPEEVELVRKARLADRLLWYTSIHLLAYFKMLSRFIVVYMVARGSVAT